MEHDMTTKSAVRRTLLATALLASTLALPAMAFAADEAAARAAAASDPEYAAGYLSSWSALHKMKPMDVMHMVDADKKGYVTREEFIKFQEQLFERMDRDQDGKVTAQEWMGGASGKAAAGSAKK
jgi:hypothetical protein